VVGYRDVKRAWLEAVERLEKVDQEAIRDEDALIRDSFISFGFDRAGSS
jgi:hypothetical protein